ncbi:dipeptidyl aminopeptidase [Panus rudis PR-1116 ss-1]|nr:dipeptidyl aminopeptidase [Panus rudis PR-1116 ss-1]
MPSARGYEPVDQNDHLFTSDAATIAETEGLGNGPIPIKPPTYYGEGPFDPPSSDDEEDTLFEKPIGARGGRDVAAGDMDMEDDVGLVIGGGRKRPSSLKCLVISLGALVGIAAFIGIIAAFSYTGTSYRIRGTLHITMDHIYNGTFLPTAHSVRWVPEAGDGVFAITQNGHISLVDLKSNTTKQLVSVNDIKDVNGSVIGHGSWELSSDMKYMLIQANRKKQWRWSSFGNYYIHNLTSHETYPLIPPTDPPTTAIAKWSPTGESIAFVSSSDLYVLPTPARNATPIRITSTGNASLFNGITDWVYEEEVYSGPTALWWSPDSSKLAFLSFDETAVDEYTFPVYNPTHDAYTVVPYPDHVTMKYPKPGYNNPLVSVRVFEMDKYNAQIEHSNATANTTVLAEQSTLELEWSGRLPANDSVIQEIAWVGNTALLVKEVNRAASNGSVVLFDLHQGASNHGEVVRVLGKNGEEGDDGWIDSAQTIFPLTSKLSKDDVPAYLDIIPSSDGYNHIALFRPASNHTPQFLTSGEWEVTDTILGVDFSGGLVHFQAANPSSTQRHIYSVPLPKDASSARVEPKALTDNNVPAVYSADFSPQAGFYVLHYLGPNVPWQNIVRVDDPKFKYILAENSKLNDTIAMYETPTVTLSTIESDGYELNVREIRPPRMDLSGKTKYPVLFQVYGGPGSQQIRHSYNIDWHHFIACSHKYIVVTVDGRGTGFKGRKLRNPVKDNLGHWETVDQINAAKIWAGKDYVDPKRIGIWGWSYGGFMSSKVVEANAGIHSLAMAVAPVASWKLYDSIYTERYMDLPQVNPKGYVTASISNVTGFHEVDYLLAHGSGDDNVHYANSAHLLDMFTAAKVRNFRFRMFTDSDHSINTRGANREVYQFMTDFLTEKWGKGPRQRGW